MTNLEIVLIIISVVFSVVLAYLINKNRVYSNRFLSLWREDRQLLAKLARSGLFSSILDVDRFNEWFNSDKDPNIYAHPGIFLRLDKFSNSHLEEYIENATGGLLSYDDFSDEDIRDFYLRIRKNWMKQISDKNK